MGLGPFKCVLVKSSDKAYCLKLGDLPEQWFPKAAIVKIEGDQVSFKYMPKDKDFPGKKHDPATPLEHPPAPAAWDEATAFALLDKENGMAAEFVEAAIADTMAKFSGLLNRAAALAVVMKEHGFTLQERVVETPPTGADCRPETGRIQTITYPPKKPAGGEIILLEAKDGSEGNIVIGLMDSDLPNKCLSFQEGPFNHVIAIYPDYQDDFYPTQIIRVRRKREAS